MMRATNSRGGGARNFRCAKYLAAILLGTMTVAVSYADEPKITLIRPPEPPPRPSLHTEKLSGDPEEPAHRFTKEQLALLEKLNRTDAAHLPRLAEIVVPDRWDLDELAYSPVPAEWPKAQAFPKALVVSQPEQVFGAYEKGWLVRWGPVSSGRKDQPTPTGIFYLNWKSKGRYSTVNQAWFLPWYFNFHNKRGISFHQFDLPGHPASHGCIRLLGRDAQWIYEWGEQWKLGPKGQTIEGNGTPVLIVGKYDYGKEAPWRTREYLDSITTAPRFSDEAESLLQMALSRAAGLLEREDRPAKSIQSGPVAAGAASP